MGGSEDLNVKNIICDFSKRELPTKAPVHTQTLHVFCSLYLNIYYGISVLRSQFRNSVIDQNLVLCWLLINSYSRGLLEPALHSRGLGRRRPDFAPRGWWVQGLSYNVTKKFNLLVESVPVELFCPVNFLKKALPMYFPKWCGSSPNSKYSRLTSFLKCSHRPQFWDKNWKNNWIT